MTPEKQKIVTVLSVPHQLQGSKFWGYVEDRAYESLIEEKVEEADFVFEEAAGCSPSIAQMVAEKMLGPGHYADVDPTLDERKRMGMAIETGDGSPIFNADGNQIGSYYVQSVEQHRMREEIWTRRILDTHFNKGLMICGSAHGLSVAFRLKGAGNEGIKLIEYLPYDKLCRRRHAD